MNNYIQVENVGDWRLMRVMRVVVGRSLSVPLESLYLVELFVQEVREL